MSLSSHSLKKFSTIIPTPEPTTVAQMWELIDLWVNPRDASLNREQLNYLLKRMALLAATGNNSNQRYSAGNGCSCTGESGITYAKSSGLGVLTATDKLLNSFIIVGNDADLTDNEITVRIIGGNGVGSSLNTSDATTYHPFIGAQNRNVIDGDDPFQQINLDSFGSITIFPKRWTTNNQCEVLITGLTGDFLIYGIM